MAMTEKDIESFISALKSSAELRERVRSAILADDFLALPGLVRANTEAIDRIAEQTEANTRAIAALTVQTDANTRAIDRIAEQTEANTRAIDRIAEQTEANTRAIDRIAEQTEANTRAIEGLIVETRELNRVTTLLSKRTDDLAGKVGNIEGDVFEGRFIRNVRAHIGPRFRRPRPLDVYSDELLEKALAQHPLSDAQLKDVATADLVLWSFDTETGEERALVIEVSRTVDARDVERAQRRAGLLAGVGVDALPVVAGIALSDDAARAAEELSVVTIIQQAEPAA